MTQNVQKCVMLLPEYLQGYRFKGFTTEIVVVCVAYWHKGNLAK